MMPPITPRTPGLHPAAVLVVGLAVGLAACAGPNIHLANRDRLEQAHGAVADGDLERAAQLLEQVLAASEEDARTFELQRFHASAELARIHTSAAVSGHPFLSRDAVAPQAHLMRALLAIGNARSWEDAAYASNGLMPESEERVLPETYDRDSVEHVLQRADLLEIVVFGNLRFLDKLDTLLEEHTNVLGSHTNAKDALDAAGIPAPVQAHALYAVHQVRRTAGTTESDVQALMLSVVARDVAHMSGTELGLAARQDIQTWIEEHALHSFSCRTCEKPIHADMTRCPDCDVSYLEQLMAKLR